MGGVCSGGMSTIVDARDGSEDEFSRKGFGKQKHGSSSSPNGDGGSHKAQKYDAGEVSATVLPKLKSSSPAKKWRNKTAEKSAFAEGARIFGLKKAAKVLGSIPGLSKEIVYDLVSRGDKVSILAFEVANTIVKGANLLESLSENNIRSTKRTLWSEGVQRLVSGDTKELLMIAASDKREEFDVFLREVIRFGDLCKDSQWHDLGQYFTKLDSGDSNTEPSREEAEKTMEELSLLARHTSELYRELNNLDRFGQDYKQKLEEAKSYDLPLTGEELVMLRDELKHQRNLVKNLKRKSLWSKSMEEVVAKFVETATYIHHRFTEAFGTNGTEVNVDVANQRLGPAGLALHYANIIVQIDTIASRPACLPNNVRDSLYQALPIVVKKALRSRLQAGSNEHQISRVKAEMDKTSRWLVPYATNTIKAHQKFGWVGDWANVSEDSGKNTSTTNDPIRLQTLYHADREKSDLYILELVVWLHHLISLVKQRVHSIGPVPVGSPSNHKPPKIRPKVQQFPPINYSIPKAKPETKLSQEDRDLLEEVWRRRSAPGRSKSQELLVSGERRREKVHFLSRSTGSSPSRDMVERPLAEHQSIHAFDPVEESNEFLEFS